MCKSDFPHSVRIEKIIQETQLVRSYVFEYHARAVPGQFVNVWLAGEGERPMSVAFDDGKFYTLSIAAVGEMTKSLAAKKVGDWIGIRGPYGTGFSWKPGQRIAMLAGGYGAAPLYFAASLAVKQKCKIDFFIGARSAAHILFANRIKKLKGVRFFPATNDGSAGFTGTNVENWKAEMGAGIVYDLAMTCGPEMMMKAVSDLAWKIKIPAQISVERYMKCGFGVCGQCCVDDSGVATCQKGPVMDNSEVRKIKEFGVYHRDSVGRKIFF